MFRKLSLIFVLAILPLAAFAYQSPGTPAGYVNDFANVLKGQERAALEQKLTEFERSSTNEIAVVIVASLDGDTIENYAVKLFEEWNIGKEDKDNGVLLLIAMEEHAIRIEVGYGLEGALTDVISSNIIRAKMIPAFQQQDYAGGINAGADSVIAATQGEYTPVSSDPAQTGPNATSDPIEAFMIGGFFLVWLSGVLARSKSWYLGGIVGALVGIFIGFTFGFIYLGVLSIAGFAILGFFIDYAVSSAYEKSKALGHRPPIWAGGGGHFGGGGFGGFGGGGSGGGGASGRW
jgi:uncharacterized protein